jgi:hypothetical protein
MASFPAAGPGCTSSDCSTTAGVIPAIRRYNTHMLDITEALEALSETLAARNLAYELVAVGGSSLVLLGPRSKHADDLRALQPSPDELGGAAAWARTHDPSPAFRDELVAALRLFGVDDADL